MNPILLATEVEARYRRYLKTTFYFKDPVLRSTFEEALSSGHLSKGPYLEATPVFKRARSPHSLFQDLLGVEPEPGFLRALQGERPLYHHQQESIRSVFEGRNVVVATGTGSGKTESFLFPILLHLYQESRAGALKPGVRALVLYPMNALANDQRDRLGEICQRLMDEKSDFGFTFGQYIGETPEDGNDSRRHAQDHMARRKPGELVLRSEMRSQPPNILLTNYSMLEYLLLRPDDSPLFDDGRARWWTFLVLDEAHQYRGARGIEMAMLLRRLKQRLREGGSSQPFRCIATSATLVGGKDDRSAVAKFASDLFGESFKDPDVILGEVETIPEAGTVSLAPDDYKHLLQAIDRTNKEPAAVEEIAARLNTSTFGTDNPAQAVGHLLQRDHRSAKLRRLVTGNPAEVKDIADQIFDDLSEQSRVDALFEFVGLLLRAEDPASGAPLLSARYHLFLRSLEGAFICFWPSTRIFVDRSAENEASTLFEVGLCRECGQHYVVGRVSNHKLLEAVRDPSRPDFGATFFLPLDPETGTGEKEKNDDTQTFRLCPRCGEIRRSSEQYACGHLESILLLKQEGAEEKEDQIPRCGACGYQAPDPVREVVHGTDGPHSVIATTLYENLPEKRKKVLAFADGRQEAAFFAWYLEHSYKDILSRGLLLKVVQAQSSSTEGSSLQDLAIGLRGILREKNVLPPATSDLQVRTKAWIDLYREFLTDEPRISLEGVGLAQWSLKWPEWFQVPKMLLTAPWSLAEQEARDVIFVLLNSMRADRAVEVRSENTVSVNWNDFQLQASQMRFRIGAPARPRGAKNWPVRSWDGVDHWGHLQHTKRSGFLEKLLMTGMSDEALEQAVMALRDIWETLRHCDELAPTTNDRLLVPVNDARRLNPEWWRLRYVQPIDRIYQCNICGRLQGVSIRGICPRHRCSGVLRATRREELEPNHYRLLYEAELPGVLRVEEHTAQLDKERARMFQREFREGKIHVLSCSTTFELGVDLGDLDTIFLRNVPPEAFNYAQRVGRAGRRSGQAGFAITYCRRGPHDLYHFAEPKRMLSGKVQPPVLTLGNEKIVSRHVAALALSSFFRATRDRFATVERLFKNIDSPTATKDFHDYLVRNRSQLENTIHKILPNSIAAKLGLVDASWISKISGKHSRFALAEAEVSSDYKTVMKLEESAREKREYKTAEWAQRRAETIAKEQVLSFLSRKAVIPKYGFPVDVVELDTQKTQQSQGAFEVSLQRDLSIAISEFAPTSRLVANKKEWTSYALKKVAEREWPRKSYARCSTHNVFLQWEGETIPSFPCGDRLIPEKYVIPQFGFVTDRDKPKDPKTRPPKVFSTRPYFAGSLGPEPEKIPMPEASPVMSIRKASPGLMVVLCEGRRGEGFYVCGSCGAGFRGRERNHRTPQGQDCHGTLDQVSLGHEFLTDVLQVQFDRAPQTKTDMVFFAFSLAYAVVEGAAEILEVPTVDLSATVAHSQLSTVPPIVIYDNVPGGAGLVARLEEEDVMRNCLQAALRRVDGRCGCAENTSCYGCLRGYRNQFVHENLQRGPVMRYIGEILAAWQ